MEISSKSYLDLFTKSQVEDILEEMVHYYWEQFDGEFHSWNADKGKFEEVQVIDVVANVEEMCESYFLECNRMYSSEVFNAFQEAFTDLMIVRNVLYWTSSVEQQIVLAVRDYSSSDINVDTLISKFVDLKQKHKEMYIMGRDAKDRCKQKGIDVEVLVTDIVPADEEV